MIIYTHDTLQSTFQGGYSSFDLKATVEIMTTSTEEGSSVT